MLKYNILYKMIIYQGDKAVSYGTGAILNPKIPSATVI